LQQLLLEAPRVLSDGRDMTTIGVNPAVLDVAAALEDIGLHQILKVRISKSWKKAL
jgi:hypothetical protein